MEITEIQVLKIDDHSKVKAYVTVTFDNCFVVHNIKVIQGKTGTYICMPNRKTKTGEYKDVAHPINPEFRAKLEELIMEKYYIGPYVTKMEIEVDGNH